MQSRRFARLAAAAMMPGVIVPGGAAFAQPCATITDVTPGLSGTFPEWQASMVYDLVGSRVLAINQAPSDGLGVLVSAYDGATWTRLPRLGQLPPGSRRYDGVWVYDAARGEALLFAGQTEFPTGPTTNTLFAFKNGAWEPRTWTGVSPPADGGAYGSYDANRGRSIFICPAASGVPMYQAWEWTGTAWEAGPECGPTDPDDFVFDRLNNRGFLNGSYFANSLEEVWYYIPGPTAAQCTWQRVTLPEPAYQSLKAVGLVCDPNRGEILRFGGHIPTTTPPVGYVSEVRRWLPEVPGFERMDTGVDLPAAARRADACAVYDPVRDRIVMFGGSRLDPPNTRVFAQDTWEYVRTDPALASASSGPVATCAGSTVLLAVAPFGGPYDMQWFKNDLPIGGATSAFLSLPNTSDADEGTYYCTLTNTCGTLRGPVSTIRVDPPVTFDAPAAWPGCSTCPGTSATIIPPTVSAASQGGPPLTLHLQKRTDLTWNDVQTTSPGGTFMLANLQRSDAGDYRIVVDGNACGMVIASTHHVEVGVAFDAQPSLQLVNPCAPATFAVQARGTCIQSYRWYKNGAPITDDGRILGAIGPALTISGARFEDEGTYVCRITDACETRDSSPADLKLISPVWVERTMNAAPTVAGSAEYWVSAYDEHRKVFVLYGGNTQSGQNSNALWEYDGYSWTMRQPGYPMVTTTSGQFLYDGVYPPNNPACAMVYNPDDHRVYLIAPFAAGYPMAILTWDGAAWARPYYGLVNGDTTRTHAVFDPVNHRIVIVRAAGGSNTAELVLYDPALNTITGPFVMEPGVQTGVHDSALWFDQRRGRVIWYNNLNDFVAPTMWSLGAGTSWTQLAGNPPRLPYATPAAYDPVRSQAVGMGGLFGSSSYFTGTQVWPGLATPTWVTALPPANDWTQVLPDGPPRNSAGAGLSPPNNWRPAFWSGMAFDTNRRAMIAAGRSVEPSPLSYAWHTYERRYMDRVVFDLPIRRTVEPGNTVRFKSYAAGWPPAGGLGYRWKRNGALLVNGPSPGGGTIAGAFTDTLLIAGAGAQDEGNYVCIATNACGAAASPPTAHGCVADFDHVDGLTVQDIFEFLNAWFASNPSADINGDGIAVQDIFDFLNLWFAGC